ncbi:hypothetical protein ATANTOWER_020579 [Ataeniobius toweri]|uniref:Uncharacterized protein n=1 Tax=Ataeniobius toweri TaxID=208326 RepID=A0ABU7ALU2_9TELE|nr:hypothetical protein [Ataeniobius toweri]
METRVKKIIRLAWTYHIALVVFFIRICLQYLETFILTSFSLMYSSSQLYKGFYHCSCKEKPDRTLICKCSQQDLDPFYSLHTLTDLKHCNLKNEQTALEV